MSTRDATTRWTYQLFPFHRQIVPRTKETLLYCWTRYLSLPTLRFHRRSNSHLTILSFTTEYEANGRFYFARLALNHLDTYVLRYKYARFYRIPFSDLLRSWIYSLVNANLLSCYNT